MGSKRSGSVPRYTPAIHAEIVRNLRVGAFRKHACEAAGIGYQTFTNWLQWGSEGREPYVKLYEDVEQAIAEDAVRNQAIVTKAAQGQHGGDWKAAAWNLTKKHPKYYGDLARGEEGAMIRERAFSPWKQPAQAAAAIAVATAQQAKDGVN